MSTPKGTLRRTIIAALPPVLIALATLAMVRGAWAQTAEPAPVPGSRAGVGVQQEQGPDIVGGREAAPGAWPWQVALVIHTSSQAYNGFFCGGSIIAPEWVLTAAHCLDGVDASLIDVLVGAHRLSANERRVQADRALMHPDYSVFTLDGDVGLLHLSEAVTNTAVAVFTPGADGAELDYLRGTVTGWGSTNPYTWYGAFPDALQEVSLPLMSHQACSSQWGIGFSDKQICAGYPVMNKAVCSGDSGGPLVVQKPDGQWRQAGIVSAGPSGCVGGTLPDIFTRAGAYKPWIDGCMQDPDSEVCTGADTYEPDDTAQQAYPYTTFGEIETHTFHRAGDQDWLKFDVKAGYLYLIQTQHIVTWTAPVDTVVWLFADEGHTPLTYNDDVAGQEPFPLFDTVLDDSRLSWRAQVDGQLYVSVENNASSLDFYRPYGPNAKYTLAVNEYSHQAYLPAITHEAEVVATPVFTATPPLAVPASMPPPVLKP
jgi:hypothetical protein